MSNVIYNTNLLSKPQQERIAKELAHRSTFTIAVGSDHPLSMGNSVIYVFSESFPEASSGYCEYVADIKSYIINIKLIEDNQPTTIDRIVELIVHETYHMVSHLFEWIRIPMVANNEAGAYTLNYYVGHAFRGYIAQTSSLPVPSAQAAQPVTFATQPITYPTILDWEYVRSGSLKSPSIKEA